MSERHERSWRTAQRIDGIVFRLPAIITPVVIVVLYAPILVIVLMSLNGSAFPRFPMDGFSLQWYERLASDGQMLNAIKNSVILAFVVALIATVLATSAGLGLLTFRRFKTIGSLILIAPVIVPAVILGLSLLTSARAAGIPRGWPLLIAGHIVITLPYAFLVISAALESMSVTFEEAAVTLGANRFHAFRETTLSLLRPALITGGAFAFIWSVQEFDGSLSWGTPSAETIPVRLYTQTRTTLTPEVNAVATFMFAVPLVIVIAMVAAGALRRGLTPIVGSDEHR